MIGFEGDSFQFVDRDLMKIDRGFGLAGVEMLS